MRWIFFLLLAANIGFYIWHSIEADRQERFQQLNASVVGNDVMTGRPLVLISELSEEEKQALASRPKESVESTAPQGGEAPESNKEPQQQKSPEASASVKQEQSTEIKKTAPPVTAEKPTEQVTTSTEAGVEGSGGEEQEEDGQSSEAEVEANVCTLIGPVSTKEYDQIAQRLLARTIVPDRKMIEAEGDLEYWVILPPLSDSAEALKKLQEVQGRGVQGQIIPGGRLANAISFGGVHASEAEAEAFAEKIRVKGFKVEIRGLPRITQEKWVALSERQTPKLTDELWQGIHQDFPQMEKKTIRCR